MYLNNLEVRFNCRLSADDYKFLVELSEQYNCSVSEIMRKIISVNRIKRGQYDTKTDFNN